MPPIYRRLHSPASRRSLVLFLTLLVSACAPATTSTLAPNAAEPDAAARPDTVILAEAPAVCPVTPTVSDTPPDDPNADPFGAGPWFINADRTLWAQWAGGWAAGPDGNKVLWIRPAGTQLTVSGRRLDGDAPPLEAWIPGGYATGFHVTALYFPEPGCWEVTATAGDHQLQFIAAIEE